ncbi:MAG: hypothetical protein WC712_10735 [Candidatus Brocadiia bacterium]
MAENLDQEVLEGEQTESGEESTLPWTFMLVLALVMLIVGIVLGYMELKEFYGLFNA